MKDIWVKYKDWFIENYPILCADELLKHLPFDKSSIKNAASRYKLKKKGKLFSWNYADELKLIELYPDKSNAELGKLFGKSEGVVSGAGFKLRLLKSPEFHRIRSAKGFFPPGHVPQNKGKKQVEYMSQEMIDRTKATRFKKGGKSLTEVHDGAITIRKAHKDRPGDKPHQYIRLGKGLWKELQIYNWEKVNGPVPRGYILACKDGDTLNCDPDNWEIMTKGDNAKRNAGHKDLRDKYVAGLLSRQKRSKVDNELRNFILEETPELVEMKRKQLILNRQINENASRKPAHGDDR